MAHDTPKAQSNPPVTEFHLLGQITFPHGLALQQRLAFEAGGFGAEQRRIVVLLCEHPRLITVGRAGSRGHVRMSGQQLERERLDVRWVNRGGGCILHAPGQLAVYPIVPLDLLGWSVGDYLRRLQNGVTQALDTLSIPNQRAQGRFGVAGRSGQLVSVGVAVRRGVASHGVFINVNPEMRTYGFVDVLPPTRAALEEKTTMGCLVAEKRTAVRMSSVRSALIDGLATAFGCQRHHLHTGHPYLLSASGASCESTVCNA